MARAQPKGSKAGIPLNDMPAPSARGRLTTDQATDIFAGLDL